MGDSTKYMRHFSCQLEVLPEKSFSDLGSLKITAGITRGAELTLITARVTLTLFSFPKTIKLLYR